MSDDGPSMKEKVEALKNDELLRNGVLKEKQEGARTYFEREVTGNKNSKGQSTVVGDGPVQYPRLPENSPWNNWPDAPEPPLGFDVNELPPMDVVGED